MNSYQTGRTGRTPDDYGVSNLTPPASSPNSKQDEFRQDRIMNGFAQDGSRFNQASDPTSTRRSPQVDLKDPIQVHLLTETALSDSKGYEILSQEEVDELKKQAELISQRVESTRSNLAIQSKYRDAAASMARLGQKGAENGRSQESERERIECERKCDQLASELLELEKRLLIPHRKILEHTAAILQLTHKASKKKTSPQNGQLVNGIPGSPESLYAYSQSRNSLDQMGDDTYFDDPSGYQLDGMERARKNAIEIPLKSPIREQNQMRVELDRMREENTYLRSQTDGLLKKLQGLNSSLRDTIVRFNPQVNHGYDEPPQGSAAPDIKLADLLKSQMDYLESGLFAVQAEQDSFAGGSRMGERIEAVNLQLRDLLMTSDPHYLPTILPSESDVNGQVAYLEESIRSIDSQLARANSSQGANDEIGPVLTSLWDSIQRGFSEAKQRKDDRRRTRVEKGLPEDDEDMSDDEGFDAAEPYSLGSFSNRVQWMHAQAITLRDQKYVLKRQIKQQRELNNKSDAEKDEELARKQEELEKSRQLLSRAEKDAMDAQRMLSDTMTDLEEARNAAGAAGAAEASIQQRDAKIGELEKNLRAAQDSLASAEKSLSTAQSGSKETGEKMAEVAAQIAALTQEKKAAEGAAQELKKELAAKTKQFKIKDDEVDQLNMTIAELKTEVTIARAELDGAYGSRAERAAEVAAIKQSSECLKLQNQVDRLKKELGATVEELEGVTKETIGSEKEKADVEAKLDEALAARTSLESELQKARDKMSELQEELDSERLKIHGDGSKLGAGASVLSERFRATMREERKKFQEDLREERTRCRKLEDELSRLKRSQGPGKSPLSPR